MKKLIDFIKHEIEASTPYYGTVYIDFTPHGSKVYIRSGNAVSPMGPWDKSLLKVFHSKDGGRWEVCGSAYDQEFSTDLVDWSLNWTRVINQAVERGYQSTIPLNEGFTGSAARYGY